MHVEDVEEKLLLTEEMMQKNSDFGCKVSRRDLQIIFNVILELNRSNYLLNQIFKCLNNNHIDEGFT